MSCLVNLCAQFTSFLYWTVTSAAVYLSMKELHFRPIKLVTFLKRMLNNSGSMSVLNVKTDPTGPVAA